MDYFVVEWMGEWRDGRVDKVIRGKIIKFVKGYVWLILRIGKEVVI